MQFRSLFATVLIVLALACTVLARPVVYPTTAAQPATRPEEWSHPSGFRFWLPDDWKIKEENEVLIAVGPEVEVYFFVPKNSRGMDRALDEVEAELGKWLKNIKYDKPTATNEGGIAEVFITGTGKDRKSGGDMEFDLGIYEKKGKIMMVFGCTTAENFDRYDMTFVKILDSIK